VLMCRAEVFKSLALCVIFLTLNPRAILLYLLKEWNSSRMCFLPLFKKKKKSQSSHSCSVRALWHFENFAELLLQNHTHRYDVFCLSFFFQNSSVPWYGLGERSGISKILSHLFRKILYTLNMWFCFAPFEKQG
jgi:hypothetical protein